jgi:nucleoside-diphosphate-sugar epimerase
MDKKMKPTVAVTGAGGLVGGHVVQHLLAADFSVIAIVRNTPQFLAELAQLNQGSLKIAQADVSQTDSLQTAFAGADVVVHAAGSVDPFGSRQAIFATNLGGTKNALAAAAGAGVKHFIFISSLSVITGQGDQFDVDESASLKPCGESYADSKIEAEQAVMTYSSSMKVTSLRPGFIYGPRERSWMPRLINSIATGKAMLIDGGTKQTNVIYVGNLCRAVELALLSEMSYGQVYNLTDGQFVSKKQLFDAIADGLGLPRVTKKVPGAVAKPFCLLVSSVAPMLPVERQRKLARFSRAAFRLAAVNQGFSIKKAESELGYTDRLPFAQGMAQTLATFKNPAGERQQLTVQV